VYISKAVDGIELEYGNNRLVGFGNIFSNQLPISKNFE